VFRIVGLLVRPVGTRRRLVLAGAVVHQGAASGQAVAHGEPKLGAERALMQCGEKPESLGEGSVDAG
jgi:hypothetical protein